jgi:hypothetical protein
MLAIIISLCLWVQFLYVLSAPRTLIELPISSILPWNDSVIQFSFFDMVNIDKKCSFFIIITASNKIKNLTALK